MNPYIIPGLRTQLTSERIISTVAKVHGIDQHLITCSGKRDRNVTDARHQAIFLTRKLLNLSMVRTAILFKRDHSTASYAVRNVPDRLKLEKEYRLLFINSCHGMGLIGEEINDLLK